jgi:rhomboid protease GluP
MDLDHLLIWAVGLTVLIAGGGLVLRHGLQYRGWVLVSALILVTLGAGLVLWPDRAGRIAALPWLLLFVVPGLGARLLAGLMARRAMGAASVLSRILALLHPFDGWREQPEYLRALEALHAGRLEETRARLTALSRHDGPVGWDARAQCHRLDGTWAELLDWIAGHPRKAVLLTNASIAAGWLRALGETGDLPGLVDAYARLAAEAKADLEEVVVPVGGLFLAAFSGRPAAVDALVAEDRLPGFSPEILRFWRATALQAAGDPAAANAELEALRLASEGSVRVAAKRRIDVPLPEAPPLDPEREGRIDDLLSRAAHGVEGFGLAGRHAPAVATFGLMAVIAGVFTLQIPGGTTDIENLVRMGALLLPAELMDGQWWRLLTANLLHFGLLHLLVNLGALWYFGRHLEQALGRVRYVLLFILSGPLALAIVVALAPLSGPEPRIVVGASAAVLAVVGATGVDLLRRYLEKRTATLKRDLFGLGLVLVAQVAFDLSTPQVGFTGHAAGMFCGVVLGFVLLSTRRPEGPGGPPRVDAARPRSR